MDDNRKYTLVIGTDGSVSRYEISDEIKKWFDEVKRIAGIRYAESIYPMTAEYPAVIDEDGKSLELPFNKIATMMCRMVIAPDDFILGNLAFLHFDGDMDMELLTEDEVGHILRYYGITSYESK